MPGSHFRQLLHPDKICYVVFNMILCHIRPEKMHKSYATYLRPYDFLFNPFGLLSVKKNLFLQIASIACLIP